MGSYTQALSHYIELPNCDSVSVLGTLRDAMSAETSLGMQAGASEASDPVRQLTALRWAAAMGD
jgi:hypothetical protein